VTLRRHETCRTSHIKRHLLVDLVGTVVPESEIRSDNGGGGACQHTGYREGRGSREIPDQTLRYITV
jgi:hypothetical protein